jgi:hypothetical protein
MMRKMMLYLSRREIKETDILLSGEQSAVKMWRVFLRFAGKTG